VYAPGKLEVVAYKNGREWARSSVETAGEAAGIALQPDRSEIRADGLDLSFVTVRVSDRAGRTVPRADNEIRFSIEGPGEIVATDNGDPTSFESFQAPQRKAFSGLCLAIVRAKPDHTGKITLTATGEGLRSAVAVIDATRAAVTR
jgi:beta-galactosidase